MPSVHAYTAHTNALRKPIGKPRRRMSFEIPLIELIRPDGYWPQPLSIEQAFTLMAWMAKTGSASQYSTKLTWNTETVATLIGSGDSDSRLKPISSISQLRRMFHNAILARPRAEGQRKWREDFGVGPSGVIQVAAPTYKPFGGARHLGWDSEQAIQDDLERMGTQSMGARMAVSLNSVHPDCRTLHGLSVRIGSNGNFHFGITYGDKTPDQMHSSWTNTLAQTKPGESFLDTFARARDVFDCLVHGKKSICDLTDFVEHGYRPEVVLAQVEALRTDAPMPVVSEELFEHEEVDPSPAP